MLHKILSTDSSKTTILIRLMVGAVFLSEGIQKFLFAEKNGAGRFVKIGLPSPDVLGSFVGGFEIVCGALVLLGLFTRLAAIPLIIIMLVAIASTKMEVLANQGFWEMLHGSRTDWAMLLGSIFLLIEGAGLWSIDKRMMIDGKNNDLKDLAKLFLKLGIIGFGGPAAHIAMMQEEVVNKRKWLGEQHFLDLIGATNLIPGPNSTEMAIHIGHERGGWRGLIVAGLCFILPAVFITCIFAWLYKKYGEVPAVQPFVYGIKPAIIAIILGAVYPLAKKSLKSVQLAIIGIVVLVCSLLSVNEIYLMFGAGILALILASFKSETRLKNFLPVYFLQISSTSLLSATNLNLFLIFLKIGAILYGSGYVLFAFLDTELVSTGLLTRTQLIDAIAVGQFTPGPVFSSVTFIGYQINGWSGAVVSTIGIFLPSFLFVALLNPLVKKMRNSKLFSAFLDAVNVASVAIIVSVCFAMGRETITDWRTIVIAVISLAVVFGYRKINSAFIVLGGALLGYLLACRIIFYLEKLNATI